MIYDVVIIGAGPAGLSCGIMLHNCGKKVLILEREKELGIKVCAGLFDEVAEEIITNVLGDLPDAVFSQPNIYVNPQVYYDGCLIINSKVKEKNLDRMEFDKWMFEKYKGELRFGATYLNHIEEKNGNIKIYYSEDGNEDYVDTKILVDASGYNSVIMQKIFPEEFINIKKIYVQQILFCDTNRLDTEKTYLLLKKDSFLNYLVSKNEMWYLCVGEENEEALEEAVEYYVTFLREKFGCCYNIVNKQVRYATDIWINPLYGKRNILGIGEAAGLWGKCGDGIRFGVQSGYLCAKSIIDSDLESALNVSEKYIEYCNNEEMTKKIVLGHGNANALNRFHRKVNILSFGAPSIYSEV